MDGTFLEATEEQLTELLCLIKELSDTDARVMLGWATGRPFPGGAENLIKLIKQDLARS